MQKYNYNMRKKRKTNKKMNKMYREAITGILPDEIAEKILDDNDFSLDVAKVAKKRQVSVLQSARKGSNKLFTRELKEFYNENGFEV